MKGKINLKELITGFDERLKLKFSVNKNSLNLLKKRTLFFDDLIRDILDSEIGYDVAREKFFVAAVGGYGRGELYPRSDVDLVIIHSKCEEGILNKIYERLIIPLIDANIEVGYSYRFYKDLPKDIAKDLTTITSLLDIRFLYGSFKLFEIFRSCYLFSYLPKVKRHYFLLKKEEYLNRLEKYNDSPYILEPNIKEGIGGLRDIHYIHWLTKALFSIEDLQALVSLKYLEENELKMLKEAKLFFSKVRIYNHYFHFITKEKLTFDLQKELALFLGYEDRESSLGVEQFMSDYYKHCHNVNLITSKIFHHYDLIFKKQTHFIRKEIDYGIYLEGFGEGEINIVPKVVKEEVRLIMKLFYYAKVLNKRLSYRTINQIQRFAETKKGFLWDDELKSLFFKIISPDRSNTKELLKDLYNSNFLSFLFPEFSKIHHKMQFDAYHIYTIDMHTIIAMSKLVDLFLVDADGIKEKIKQPHLLALAVLLHDIGKGEGKEHAEKGASIAEVVLKRMDLTFRERELIIFLVRNHLLLSHIAQRRDISDFKFLKKVYKDVIKSKENLYYLYFLTVVDLMAVGDTVWNNWKEKLLRELLKNFEKVALSDVNFTEEEFRNKREKLEKRLVELNKSYLIPLLTILPENFVISTDLEEIIRCLEIDYELVNTNKPYILKVRRHKVDNLVEIFVATQDQKGLFYQLAGVLTYIGLNILSANINTRKNGNVLDIFMVDLGSKDFEYDKNIFHNLELLLEKVIVNKERIDKMVIEKAKRYHKKSVFKEKNEVFFDNNSSEDYTIIEVYAEDHMGLLFEITKALYDLGLDIYFSKVNTMGHRAIDTFYVLKNEEKILDPLELDHIKNHLLRSIGQV